MHVIAHRRKSRLWIKNRFLVGSLHGGRSGEGVDRFGGRTNGIEIGISLHGTVWGNWIRSGGTTTPVCFGGGGTTRGRTISGAGGTRHSLPNYMHASLMVNRTYSINTAHHDRSRQGVNTHRFVWRNAIGIGLRNRLELSKATDDRHTGLAQQGWARHQRMCCHHTFFGCIEIRQIRISHIRIYIYIYTHITSTTTRK